MSHGYATIFDVIGEIVSLDPRTGVFVWELRPEIKRWRYVTSSTLEALDQPPLYEVARFYEEFWTAGVPLPATNGLYAGPGQELEVLKVTLEPSKVQITLRKAPGQGSARNV